MTGLHYPDNLYADALAKDQAPVGAYRAPTEIPEAERKLRTLRHYLYHATLLLDEVLGDNKPKAQREAKIAYDVLSEELAKDGFSRATIASVLKHPERVPKWDPKWVETCPQRASHPMNAETIRDHDERMAGGEDRL